MFLRGKSYAVLGIAFFSMLIRFPFDLKQFHIVDEAVIGTLANIILRGGLVYRDGWCHRGPMLDYVYAGIFSVFGNGNMVAVHLITSLLIALQTLLLYRITSLLFDRRVALVASCLFAFFSTFGYPPADAARVVATEAAAWAAHHPGSLDEIRLVGFDTAAEEAFDAGLAGLD